MLRCNHGFSNNVVLLSEVNWSDVSIFIGTFRTIERFCGQLDNAGVVGHYFDSVFAGINQLPHPQRGPLYDIANHSCTDVRGDLTLD
jgi:hypothetical protein